MSPKSSSLPMRERELKRLPDLSGKGSAGSLPMRERELKPPAVGDDAVDGRRSPCGSVN